MDIAHLLLAAVLIGLTAFFVTTEFALVKVRTSKIDQLVEEGSKRALAAKKVITDLDDYLSVCKFGITVTTLGLGWMGEPTVERLLHPVFQQFALSDNTVTLLSFGIAFSIITFLHVVIGELAPKALAIQKAEAMSLMLAGPIILLYKIMYPLIWILNGSARILTKAFGLQPASEYDSAHSEEELRIMLTESYQKGEINQSEFKYVNRIFDFDNRLAKEIMIPRTEMITLSNEASLEDSLSTMTSERFTRYPVVNGDKDHIVGMIHAKEVFGDLVSTERHLIDLSKYLRPVIQMIEATPISELLITMQKERTHMAIILDEYGGTAGLVTAEDIIEEIVGEMRDEFDAEENPFIQKVNDDDTHYLLDGKVLIEEVNDLLGISIDDDDIDTIGGWLLSERYNIIKGDIVSFEDCTFTLKEAEGHQIKVIEVKKEAGSEDSDSEEELDDSSPIYRQNSIS
ncbi:hemolysin family protein [Alteribacillus sp. HJP-4]|uniref:hemolysin family protein n=1 Tax=Alteribacillus sp. HJP-4 TaxID=2775394 RepID=UPI0035CD20D3